MVAHVQSNHGHDESAAGGSVLFFPGALSTWYVQFKLEAFACDGR